MARTAFVTGGTGFIGLNLVQELLEQGWQVTALHRPNSDLTYLSRFPVALAEGSLTDIASLRDGLPDGTEAVFHVAGDTNMWSKFNDRQMRVNVTGTENMVAVAKEKGVGCFIDTSSISAWGKMSGQVTEETPQRGRESRVNYEYSKWAGEQVALEAASDDFKVVALCPGVVLGPYDLRSWGQLFFVLRDGELPFSPPGHLAMAHSREVARAHVAAVDKGRAGARYILAGDERSVPELTAEISRLVGVKARPTAPPWLLRIMGRLAVMTAAVTGNPPLMTPELAEIAARPPVSFSSDLATAELGYKSLPMETGLRDNYDWLVAEGLLEAAA
jgi:nucleoside-diphosphate-sugar epimerase